MQRNCRLHRVMTVIFSGVYSYTGQGISLTSHTNHGVSDHRSLGCLFNNLLELTSKKHLWSAILAFVKGLYPHKGPVMRKSSAYHYDIIRNQRKTPITTRIFIIDLKLTAPGVLRKFPLWNMNTYLSKGRIGNGKCNGKVNITLTG